MSQENADVAERATQESKANGIFVNAVRACDQVVEMCDEADREAIRQAFFGGDVEPHNNFREFTTLAKIGIVPETRDQIPPRLSQLVIASLEAINEVILEASREGLPEGVERDMNLMEISRIVLSRLDEKEYREWESKAVDYIVEQGLERLKENFQAMRVVLVEIGGGSDYLTVSQM